MLPAHRRVPHRRSDLGHPVGPLRSPPVRHRRHARHRHLLRPAGAACRSTSPTGSSPSFSSSPGCPCPSFGSPNRAGVMNSLPPEHRGAGSGMNTTFQNSAQVLSIGIFFTLMIVGLSGSLPAEPLPRTRRATACRQRAATTGLAPAAGVHPVRRLLGLQPGPAPASGHTSCPSSRTAQQAVLTGRSFFPVADRRPVPAAASTPRSTSPSWPACWRPRLRGLGGRNPSPKW